MAMAVWEAETVRVGVNCERDCAALSGVGGSPVLGQSPAPAGQRGGDLDHGGAGRGERADRDRRVGRLKEELLLALLPLPNGIPRKDVFRRVLSILHPAGFQACFVSWLTSLRGKRAAATGVEQPVLAIDGQTLRRSHDRSRGLGALHSVSVWATDYGLTLGQVSTDEKSNAPVHLHRARRFPSCSSWSTSAARSSRSTRWEPKRPSRKRSSAAGPTSCWR